MKISREEKVECPTCNKTSKLGEWSDNTYSRCVNREMKRCFLPLTDSKAFLQKTDKYYICPKCEQWAGGYSLKIVGTDSKFLQSLGGKANMKVR